VLQYKLKEKKSKTATFTFAYSLAFFIIFISFWPRRTNCTAQRKVDELAKLAINFVEEWFHFVPGNGDTLICSVCRLPKGRVPGPGADSIEPTYKINNSINNIRVEFCGGSEKWEKKPNRLRDKGLGRQGKAHGSSKDPGVESSIPQIPLILWHMPDTTQKRKLNQKNIGPEMGQGRQTWTGHAEPLTNTQKAFSTVSKVAGYQPGYQWQDKKPFTPKRISNFDQSIQKLKCNTPWGHPLWLYNF